jgi:hypothetical protein
MKVLSYLSLIEFSENNPNIIWKGPDFFNLLGFCKEDMESVKDNPNRLLSSYGHYLKNFADEIFNRELSYYKNILDMHIKSEEFNVIFKSICTKKRKEDENKFGYAMLKSETITFYIKEFRIIIGRSSKKSR